MTTTELMQRAERKDPKAMFEMAEAYYLGDKGVNADDSKAFSLYKELEVLTPDDAMVLYRLGKCYELGISEDKNMELALDYFRKAVEKGSGIACKTLGEFYKSGKYVQQDISKCLTYLNQGASMKTPGSDEAAIMLGDMYHYGDEGVEKNDIKACDLYRIAAELGNSNAYYRLGMQTFNGWGVEADKAHGMEYWQKGAELNHWGCMYIIGVSYLEGNDLPKDADKGLYWLERSADRGLADAQCYLGKTYLRGLHGVSRNEEKGIRYLKAAAESDQAEAMMIYGDYLYGKKTAESLSEALKLYQKAAELGEPAAFHRLGILTYNGAGVEADKAKGIMYWKKGVEFGQAGCMYIIGGTYLVGIDLPKDTEQGLYLLEKAASHGMPEAHNYLGKVYLHGLHEVQQDAAKALPHLKSAAESGQVEAMVMLGDYYGGLNTDAGFVEADKWYELAAPQVPYAMRQAIAVNQIMAVGGPSEGWEKVAGLARKAIELFQRDGLKQRDEYLDFAKEAYRDAKYQQALCCYEAEAFSKAQSLSQDLNYRDSGLLNALAFFGQMNQENGDLTAAFKNLLPAFAEASRSVAGGRELRAEEEKLHATAASVVASGYQTGFPNVLQPSLDSAAATLRSTIGYLSGERWIKMLNEQLEQYNVEAASKAPPQKMPVSPPEGTPDVEPKAVPFGNPKPAPGPDGTGTNKKPLSYAIIGLVGLAAVILLIFALGNKEKQQPSSQTAEEPTIQATDSVDIAEEPEQTAEGEPAAGTKIYQLPTYKLISHPSEFYGSRSEYEYSEDGTPLSAQTEVEGNVYRAEFDYKKGFIIQSALYDNDQLECTGIYNYDNGVLQSISYTCYSFGQESTGSVDFYYLADGNTYIIDIVPNMGEGYYYLPESFLEIPGIGGIPFGVSELRFEYQMNDDGTIYQLHVRNKEAMEFSTAGWTVQYHRNGVPSMVGYEYVNSPNNYQVFYDENGLPIDSTGVTIERIPSLDFEGQSFTESEFVRIIGYVDATGERDYYQYEVYETDDQHSQLTRRKYSSSGELMEDDTIQWAYYSFELLDSPFPYLYHRDLSYD